MTDNFREKYSKVFIPFIDVYELSGVEVFSRFSRDNDDNGKNLIVIPMNFIERLDEFKDKSNSVGAIDELPLPPLVGTASSTTRTTGTRPGKHPPYKSTATPQTRICRFEPRSCNFLWPSNAPNPFTMLIRVQGKIQ